MLETKPLVSFEELNAWKGLPVEESSLISKSPFDNRFKRKKGFQTLLCHDMKGGYLADRFCNGCSEIDAYRFYNWIGVDGFIYFSHNFITIPPIGWINAAHKHSVCVLGTIITEWDKGREICNKFLQDEETVENTVMKLVDIADKYHFEGWLINIENKIDLIKIPLLLKFVKRLYEEMHKVNSSAQVIWYDSVTENGDLKWQNKLNGLNKCFFDACDGIFLNYSWNETDLKESKTLSNSRNYDVYVGLDVFGRNFYKGGGFNTGEALKLAHENELSIAIFAPGWTYEFHGSENFFYNENKFWTLLNTFLEKKGPTSFPFVTNFCQGFGKNVFKDGKVICDKPWYNLSLQEYQPLWIGKTDECITMSLTSEDSYNGGSCVELSCTDGQCGTTCLFTNCQLALKEQNLLSISTKWISVPCKITLVLKMEQELDCKKIIQEFVICNQTDDLPNTSPCPKEVKKMANGWSTTNFVIATHKMTYIREIDIKMNGPGKLLLGKLAVTDIQ